MLTSSSTSPGRSATKSSSAFSPQSASSGSNFIACTAPARTPRTMSESSTMRIFDMQQLERYPGLDQELCLLDAGVRVEREGEVGVQHVALGGACAEQAQAEADVAQPAGVDGVLVLAFPGAPDVGEHCAADTEKAQRIPVGVGARLERKERTALARLVAQRIAAQAVLTADQQRARNIRVVHRVGRNGGVIHEVAPLTAVIPRRDAERLVLALVRMAPGRPDLAEDEAVAREIEA